MVAIVKTADVLGGEPRLEGRRITVLQVADLVCCGYSAAYVADQLDVTLAEVHEAMATCYRNSEEIEAIRRADADLEAELRERSNATKTAT